MKTSNVTSGGRIDATGRLSETSQSGAARLRSFIASVWIDAIGLVLLGIFFVVPFIFIVLTAAKTRQEAALFQFTWPSQFQLFQNIQDVAVFGNYRMFRAMWNSSVLTVTSITLIVLLASMVAYVMQRRQDRAASIAGTVILAGLIIPPAVVPTIFLLQWLHIYKTLFGLILIEVAFALPFATITLRTFMTTIPREIDEAAIIDGASPTRVFVSIILPLLRPAIITLIVVSSVAIYNDFANPLYFLPGEENVTVQLTLFSFISQFTSQWNLLFANVVLITLPPLILYIFFQRQIVAGMTAGAVKG